MDALAQADGRCCRRILELPDPVYPGAGRVDDRAGAHRDAVELGAADTPSRDPQVQHRGVVEDGRAGVGGRPDVCEAQPGVVRPRVGVQPAAPEALSPEVGHALTSAVRCHHATEPLPRESRVEPESSANRGGAVGTVVVERNQERKAMNEVRSDDAGEHSPLCMSLSYQPHVAEAEIAKPSVDELRGGAGRGAAEVALVDERDGEPRARRLVGDAGADDSAADDQQVERARPELVERACAPA